MVKYQALTYIPILMFARLTWALQSVVFAYHMSRWGGYFAASSPAAIAAAKAAKAGGKSASAAAAASAAVSAAEAAEGGYTLRYEVLEKVCLLVHYAWYLTLAFAWNDVWTGLAFILVSQTWSGILIALAFGVGHNGMMIYDMEKKPGFSELQVTTTRNVHDGPFIGWFMGGLHYQIEHHLYPTMPRHNLKIARTFVEPLCKKHGVPYRCTGLWEGTVEVLRHLDDVSHALAEFPAI
jgi:fatty acid desaturase